MTAIATVLGRQLKNADLMFDEFFGLARLSSMIRLVTTVAFSGGLLLVLTAILAFIAGLWIVGVVAGLLGVVAVMFSLAGMSIIVVSEVEL